MRSDIDTFNNKKKLNMFEEEEAVDWKKKHFEDNFGEEFKFCISRIFLLLSN